MALPIKLNSGNLKDLSAKGITPQTIDIIEEIRKKGINIESRNTLEKFGIPKEEIDKIGPHVTFGEADPVPEIKSATIETDLKGLPGYMLVVRYQNKLSKTPEEFLEDVYSIALSGETQVNYDDKIAGNNFWLAVKSPAGAFAKLKAGGKEVLTVEVKKTELNGTKLNIVPAAPITTKHKPVTTSKIKGRLLSDNPSQKLEGIQIVFEVAIDDRPSDEDYFPVCYAVTEHNGYFFSSQIQFNNLKELQQARAKIGLAGQEPIEIKLEEIEDLSDPASPAIINVLPEKVILYIHDANPEDLTATDCDCDCKDLDFHEKKSLEEFSFYTVVRTTEPLIEAYEINDVDGIDLGDIVFDPDAKGVLNGIKLPPGVIKNFILNNGPITKANATDLLNIAKKLDQLKNIKDKSKIIKPKFKKGRIDLDGTNEVDWDDKPTIYQATTIAHGHLLHFKQDWYNDGYTIGDLLYSLPLAPGQKKQIVVFDWDRKDSASNTQQLDYQENLYNSLSRDRDVNEIAKATVSEHMDAKSEASAWGWGVGGGVGAAIPIPAGPAIIPVGALVGAGGGGGGGSSSASQNSLRTSTASSNQHINDRTVQAANSVRSQRATVIQTVSQGERFQVSAEVIANYNHCHAMTVEYFEVLRHFEIITRLANVQECLFIPLKLSEFDRKKALRWRDILTRCLKKRFLLPGFDALERYNDATEKCGDGNKQCIDNYYDELGIPNERYAEEALVYIEGELYLEFQIRMPDILADLNQTFTTTGWTAFGILVGLGMQEFYESQIKNENKKDEAFAKHAGPRIAEAVINGLQFFAVKNGQGSVSKRLPIDATLLSDFRSRAKLNISLRMSGALDGTIKREDIDFIKIAFEDSDTRSNALDTLINGDYLKVIVHSGSMRYRTRSLHEYLFNESRIKNDLRLNDDVNIFTPLSARALRRPRLEDVELTNALLHHLNENIEYYHQCIWLKMDPQRRFMLLDGLIAPGKGNGRSVASVVENKLIGIVGNCIVMPVAPGFQLDPTLDDDIDLFEHYYEDPKDPVHLSLPTKGVFAEAVMGKCNSCEKKDESRFWRWEESPIPDSPTTINPLTLPTPQNVQPTNLQPKDFPSPIINLQAGPSLPDPQGFAGLVQLLSNPNLFRDITGLNENQKNALAALQSAFGTAQFFGGKAADLTNTAASLVPTTAKLQALEQIKTAKENGLITEVQAQELTQEAFKSIIGNSGSSASQAVDDIAKTEKKVKENAITQEDADEIKTIIKEKEKNRTENEKSTLDQPEVKDAVKDSSEITHEKPNGEKTILKKTAGKKKRNIHLQLTIHNPYGRPIPYEIIQGDDKILRILSKGDVREINIGSSNELFNPTYIIELDDFSETFAKLIFQLGTIAGNFLGEKDFDIPSSATVGSIIIKLLSNDETIIFKKSVSATTTITKFIQEKYLLGASAAAKFAKLIGTEATLGLNFNFEETEADTESNTTSSSTERTVSKVVKVPNFAIDIIAQFR